MSRKRTFKKVDLKSKKFPAIRIQFKKPNEQILFFKLLDVSLALGISQTELARRVLKNWFFLFKEDVDKAKVFADINLGEDLFKTPYKIVRKSKKI